jgi:hypothetical protein
MTVAPSPMCDAVRASQNRPNGQFRRTRLRPEGPGTVGCITDPDVLRCGDGSAGYLKERLQPCRFQGPQRPKPLWGLSPCSLRVFARCGSEEVQDEREREQFRAILMDAHRAQPVNEIIDGG